MLNHPAKQTTTILTTDEVVVPARSPSAVRSCTGLWIRLVAIMLLALLGCSHTTMGGPQAGTERDPVIVKLRVGSFRHAIDSSSSGHKALKKKLTTTVQRAARARRGRLIAIQVVDLKLEYSSLSASKRRQVRKLAGKGEDPRVWYEQKVSSLLRYLVRKAAGGGGVSVSVVDVPLEKVKGGQTGLQAVNDRYASLMNNLDAFVITRPVTLSGGDDDPASLLDAMPQAVAYAKHRPIFYREGSKWQVIADPAAVREAAATGETGGSDPESDSQDGTGRPLFLICQSMGEPLLPVMVEVGAQQSKMIYQVHADPDQTGTLDLVKLQRRIEQYVPPDYTGFVCFDFESPYSDWLWQSPDDPKYIQAQQQLVAALRMAKGIRPNAKWSVWSQPMIRMDRGMIAPPMDLIAAMDWFGPAIYDRYIDDAEPNLDKQRDFVTWSIQRSKELADGRPVLPFVTHRYAPRNRQGRYQPPHLSLIPDEEIRRYVSWALEAGANGIVWWGSDSTHAEMFRDPPPPGTRRYERFQRLKVVYAGEKPQGMSYESYSNSLHRRLLRLFAEELSSAPAGGDDPDAAPPVSQRDGPDRLTEP